MEWDANNGWWTETGAWAYVPGVSGNKRVRVVAYMRQVQLNEDGAAVQARYRAELGGTIGKPNKDELSVSWSGDVRTVYSTGTYFDTGWTGLGRYRYGEGESASLSAKLENVRSYKDSSGTWQEDRKSANANASASITVESPQWQPRAPQNVTLRVVYPQSTPCARLTWGWSETGARPIKGYKIERSLNGTAAWVTMAEVSHGSAPHATREWTDTTCVPGASYRWRICSYNEKNTSGWVTTQLMRVDPLPPQAPGDLEAVYEGDVTGQERVTLKWSNTSTDEAPWSTVRVYRSCDGGPMQRLKEVPGTSSEWCDATPAAGHRYRYRVVALNISEGDAAETGDVWTRPLACGRPAASRLSAGSLRVELAASDGGASCEAVSLQRSVDKANWGTVATALAGSRVFVDACGPGAWWYRARNEGHGLASAWSYSLSAAPEEAAPAAPTPLPGEPVRSSLAESCRVEWVHNPRDGSAQSGYTVAWSVGGEPQEPIDGGEEPWCDVPTDGLGAGSEVTWSVATKGSSGELGPYCAAQVFALAEPPDVWAVSPEVEPSSLPVVAEVGFIDAAGQLVGLTAEATSDSELLWRGSSETAVIELPNDLVVGANGSSFSLTLTARSSTGVSASVQLDVAPRLVPAKLASARAVPDQDRGEVTLRVSIDLDGEGAAVEGVSVWRVWAEGRELVASGLLDGDEVVDQRPPLNAEFSYDVVAEAPYGAPRTFSVPGSVRTPYSLFKFGERIARWRMDHQVSTRVSKPERQLVRYAGREWPVLYDTGATEQGASVDGYIVDEDEAAELMALAREGRCLYQGVDGSVYDACCSVSVSPKRPGVWAVSVELERVDPA